MKNALAILAIAGLLWVGLGGALPHVPDIVKPHVPLIEGGGLSVLILEETDDRRTLTKEQLDILASVEIRKFVKANNGEIRVWDKDIDAANDSEKWRNALTIERQGLPWLIVSGPKGNYSGPLPADVAATEVVIGKCVE